MTDVYLLPAIDLGDGDAVAVCWDGRGPYDLLNSDGTATRRHTLPGGPDCVERIWGLDVDAEREDRIGERLHEAELKAGEKGHAEGVDEARRKVLDLVETVTVLPEVQALFVDGLNAGTLLANELRERVRLALRTDS